jgi:hypothetical protein
VVRTAWRPDWVEVARRDTALSSERVQACGHATRAQGAEAAVRTFSDHLRCGAPIPHFEHALQEAMPKERALGAGGQLDQGSDRRAFLAVVPAAAVTG